MAKAKTKKTAHRIAQKGKPRGKPFEPGNKYAFKKGEIANPGGRPKSISGAYKAWLEQIDDETGFTHAQLVAQAQGQRAIIAHDTTAAKELRQATEGDTLKTWQSEIIDALKNGNLTPEQVVKELGIDDARSILIAAGAAIPTSASQPTSTEPTTGTDAAGEAGAGAAQ
jgi:hypothetical protein